MSDLQNRGSQEIMNRPLVQFLRGSREIIDNIDTIEDGRLFFATDTKQIMLDCDFTDSEANRYNQRITFGGSTGIHYAFKEFSDREKEEEIFVFSIKDFDSKNNNETLPEIDDLILNLADKSFYRVSERNESVETVTAEKLMISGGSGDGGASYIKANIVNNATRYYTKQDEMIPIEFSCTSSLEGAIISAKIYINNIEVANIDTVKQSDSETNIIDLKQYITNIGEQFLINESNNVSVVLLDDYGATRTLKYYITVYDLYVIPAAQSIPVKEESFLYQCYPYGGIGLQNRQLIFELRNVGEESVLWDYEMSLEGYTDGSEVNLIIPFQEHGTYSLSVHIEGIIPQTGATLVSEPLIQQIMFYESGQSAPLISISSLEKYKYTQYDRTVLEYIVAYGATTHSSVNLIIEIEVDGVRKRHSSTSVFIENNKNQTWNIDFTTAGYYYLTVEIADTEYIQTTPAITVTAFEGDVPEINIDNSALELYLTAFGRSNAEAEKDSWIYLNKNNNTTISCEFKNFNWQSNGWKTDEQGITSLHLDNGAQLIIPFSPFPANGSATNYGKTIELDFKISNVRSAGEELITCLSKVNADDESSKAVTGFVITESQSALNSNALKTIGQTASTAAKSEKGLIVTFKEDERIHITYAINSLAGNPERMVFTYINGIISGLVQYHAEDTFADATDKPSKFIFMSDNADIDIYNIRVYAQSLNERSVLYNYIADQHNPEQKVADWEDNNVLDTQTQEISLVKVEKAKNIPYMVFEDGRASDEDGKITAGAVVGALPTGKKDYRYCNVYYVDPIHPEKNFPKQGTCPMVIYGQGTSSMSYPVKNLRIKFLDSDTTYALRNGDNGEITPVNLFCLKADYMESSSSHNTATGNTLSELYASIDLYTPAQLTYGFKEYLTAIVGHPIICFFKSYDSSGKSTYEYIGRYNFNLDKATPEPFGFFEDVNKHYGVRLDSYPEWNSDYAAKALKANVKGGFDHTLDGKLVEGKTYYIAPSLEEEAIWSGTSEQFKSYLKTVGPLYEYSNAARSIQCWEFLDNGQALCGMRVPWNEAEDAKNYDAKGQPYSTWRSAFECRYPEPDTKVCTDKRAMARVINWLVSTNQNLAKPDVLLPESEWLTAVDNGATIVYKYDTKEYRLLKFKQQFYDYFRMDYTAFYYVFTEVLCMMDSRAKNMMFCTFDADPDAGTGHWFPIFYDMDTMFGVNNSGYIEFDYNVEDNAALQVFNGSSNYNHHAYSTLWCNFRQAFQAEIRDMYNNLRRKGKLNYNYLITLYDNNHVKKWNETYMNEDANYKYIRPLTESWWDDNEGKLVGGKDGGIDYLYIAQGTRSEHRRYWLYNRFNYLDTKYEYLRFIEAHPDVDFRTNTPSGEVEYDENGNITVDSEMALKYQASLAAVPSDLSFNLTSLVDQFAMMKYSQTETPPVKVLAGETVTINPPANLSAHDTETFIQAAVNYTDYGDLSNKYISKIAFNQAVKIRKLKLGNEHPDYYNPKLNSLGSSFSTVVPYLEELDIQHCHALSGTLDLTNCSYLQTVKAKGTSCKNITFPVGGNLKFLSLPATLNTLKIHNHLYYDTIRYPENLVLESYDNLYTLWIQDCPLVDTKQIILNSPQLQNIRLMDINWTLTLDECYQDANGLIVGSPILDKLIYSAAILDNPDEYDSTKVIHGLDANGQRIARTEIGNQYLAGTIIINNKDASGNDVGVSDIALYEKYTKLFPNIKFAYKANSLNKKAYTVNICDAQKQPQYRYLHKMEATEDNVNAFNDNLETWFADPESTPVLIKTPSVKYKYQFLGWNTIEPMEFAEAEVDKANEALVIKIETTESGERVVTRMNEFALTKDSFTDMEFSFYPTYAAIIQEYTVTFYEDDEYTKVLKTQRVKYGHAATPPDVSPQRIELDANDVSKAWIYPFTGYHLSYNNIVGDLRTYATYGAKTEMSSLTGDQIPRDWFEVNINTYPDWEYDFTGRNIIKLRVKPDFTGEAIIVPKEWTNEYGMTYPVVQIDLFYDQHDYCTTLRRMFFEKDNEITAIGEFLDRSTEGPLCNNFEYLDFSALSKLKFIGRAAFHLAEKMLVTSLPNSIEKICENAFGSMPNCRIQQLPQNLKELRDEAFSNCHSLQSVDINTATQLATIGNSAFQNCINLVLADETIIYPETIGESAFRNCSKLVLNFATANQSQIRFIEREAFYNSARGLQNLPPLIEKLGPFCFMAEDRSDISNNDVMGFSVLPETLREIGSSAFQFRTTASDMWYLQPVDPSQINIAQYAFEGIKNLNTLQVNWNLTEAAQIQPYLSKGWTIHGTVTVVDEDGNSLND